MPGIAEIFRDWGGRYIQAKGAALTAARRKAISDIRACRTPAIGAGLLHSCPKCGSVHFAWRSCGNRNCPKCGNERVTRWLEARSRDVLPVDYHMATFTLPSELRAVCRQLPSKVFGAFFKAASEALKELALDRRFLGGRAGMLGTLQTWRRDGGFHPHIHFLVPGGGISRDGQYWLFPKCRAMMLAPRPLAKLFKGKLRAEMSALGLLDLIPPEAWRKRWNIDCRNVGDGMSAFKYLAPYMQRVFICDDRIESYDGESVTYRYKDSHTGRTMRRTLHALDFMELLLQHVLPPGFQKTRYYGILGSACKREAAWIRALVLASSGGRPPKEPEPFAVRPFVCAKCGAAMLLSDPRARGPPERAA
jgi:uncharacterized Zn finger protein (UPF0148 family)